LSRCCTWRWRGQTYTSQCVCALVFRRRQESPTAKRSSESWGTFVSLLNSGYPHYTKKTFT
jgi:hypothetical protein